MFIAWARTYRPLNYALTFLLVMLLTLLHSPVAFQSPYLPEIGDIAHRDVHANKELLVEDVQSTARRREDAEQKSLPVYDWDSGMVEQIVLTLRDALAWLVHLKKSGPMTEEELRQVFVQRLNEEIQSEAFHALLTLPVVAEKSGHTEPHLAIEAPGAPSSQIDSTNPETMVRLEGYTELLETVRSWLRPLGQQRVVSSTDTLHDMDRSPYVINSVDTGREIRLIGSTGVISLDEMRMLITRSARDRLSHLPKPLRQWLIEEVRAQVRPNIVLNLAETTLRKQHAVEAVDVVYFRVRRGELVLRKGDVVTAAARLKIEALNEKHWTGVSVARLLGLSGTIALLLLLGRWFLVTTSFSFPRDRRTVYILGSILLSVSMLNMISLLVGRGLVQIFGWSDTMDAYLPPVALGAALTSLLVGSRVSLPGGSMIIGAVLAFLTALVNDGDLALFVYYFIGSLTGAVSMRSCRHRFDVLRAGLWIGLAQMVAVPAVVALGGDIPDREWLVACGMAFSSGILSGLLGLALIPIMEKVFNLTTDSRLLELASGDHPLLKQLSLRTPGTYHHSVMMGNLAEAAAESIGANPLMARVMALYHDIGKMNKPHYFVENQSGENRHDHLLPSMSAKIIVCHIKDGIELAKQYKLGAPIIEAITTHQGTTLLQFFYNKALNEAAKKGEVVNEADYRYPGPRPRTRESGILMLADAVEAAARTLKTPSPAQIQALVRRIINTKIADGQLDECRLTLGEMGSIEDAFCRVLILGFYHQRIAYPDLHKKRLPGGSGGGR
jgi:putative nucleotidyltransferase with HDIG domain